jgi:hypothetical protein
VTLPAPHDDEFDELDELDDDQQLVLGDLLNHVLDKGVVIHGSVTISVANIDLVAVDLRLVLSSVESLVRREARDRDARDRETGGS